MNSSDASNKREKNSSKIGRILNSTMAFIIAYLSVMLLFCLVTALVGRMFGFEPQIYFYGIKFLLGRYHWSTGNAFWIWSSATLFSVLLGIACSRLYFYLRGRVLLFNLVALWASIIAYGVAAAQTLLPLLSGYDELSPFYTNLSIAFNFANLPVWALYVICIAAMLLLVSATFRIAKSFLSFSYSFSKVNRRSRRRKYYAETALLPFALGSSVIFLLFHQTYQFYNFDVQNLLYILVIGATLVLSLFVSGMSEVGQDEVLRYKNLQQLNAALFVIMMIMIVFLVVLYQGVFLPF